MDKTIVTFPCWGNYTTVFQKLFERLGVECILPEETNQETVRNGAKLSPELFCLPLKVNIGNYLSAIEKGANTILMWENLGGICRLRYYWLVQDKILKEQGHKIEVLNLNYKNFFSRVGELRNKRISFWQFLKSLLLFFREIRFIEKLEEKTWHSRPREKNQGETEKIFREALEKFREAKKPRELSRLRKETWRKLSQIETKTNHEPIRVGLIGEIYTISDGKVNLELEKKLGEQGAEVHRELNLSRHLLGGLFWRNNSVQRKANPFLKTTVGGHGREAVAEMLDCAKNGFDGVIQVLPMSCMPEVTVRPILQKISQERKIPFLSISLDEQTAETGIQTRLEAFIDLMKSRKKNAVTNSSQI